MATAVCAGLLALCAGACGGAQHPHTGTHHLSPVAQANARHEYPGPPAPAQRAPGATEPAQAVRAFARVYINWTAGDLAARLTGLARTSIGQARSEMTLAAAEARVDSALRQGEIANRGSVEAVARLTGSRNRYVVVTREATTSGASGAYQGLAPAWHLTLATVAQEGSPAQPRWVVSGWRPES